MLPDSIQQRIDRLRNASRPQSIYLRLTAWFVAGSAIIVIVCCFAFIALINTQQGHRYLIGLAQKQATDALGVPVTVQNFALHLPTLSLDLYGVRISGASPYPDPPLLQADHLNVGVRVTSVLSRSWYLSQIQIDHPVAWVVVDKNGTSNLPVFKSSNSSNTSVFDLGIRRAEITRGEVYYNSRPYTLTADLHNLAFNSSFSSPSKRYSGKLAYSNGDLKLGSLQPLEHSLETEFDATPTTFTLKRSKVSVGGSQATIAATVGNYNNPVVKAQYQINLDSKQAADILKQPTLPEGYVQTSGVLQYQQTPGRSAIDSLTIDGNLGSSKLTVNTSSARADVTNLSARYLLSNGNASIQELRANVMGGEVTADGTMQAVDGNSRSRVRANLHNVSLAELKNSLAPSATAKGVALSGTGDVTATATWGKTINDLIAHADIAVDGKTTVLQALPNGTRISNLQAAAPQQQAAPIQATLHATYENAHRSLALKDSTISSSGLKVALNGAVGNKVGLSVYVEANDLSQIAVLANSFSSSQAPPIEVKGQATFTGTVQGSTSAPHLSGQFSAKNLEYNGTQWKSLNTGVDASPSHAGLQNLRLESADRGGLTGSASLQLDKWSIPRDGSMQIDLGLSSIPMSTIAKIAAQRIPVTGTLNAEAHLHGTMIAPTGNANIRLTDAMAFGERLSQARVDLTGSGDNVKASARLELTAGSVQAQVTTNPRAKTYNAQVTSNGIDLAKLQSLKQQGTDAKGVVKISAHGEGTYDDPAVDADVEIPSLNVNGQVISQTRLHANEAHHTANVEFASLVANAPLHGKVQVSLQGDYDIDGSVDTPAIPIQSLLDAYAPETDPNLGGQIEVHGTIHGPLKDKNRLQAQVKIPLLKIGYGNSVALSASPIQADYRDGMVRLQPVSIRGTDSELNLQGAFPVGGHGQASLQAQGLINLQIVQIFDSDLRTSGQLKINVNSHGATAQSLMSGEVDVVDANISTITSPVSLQHANGVLKLTSDRLSIDKFEGALGGGSITAQGAVAYRPNLQLDLGVAVKDAQILYPQGVRETANANLRLSGTAERAMLGGTVTLSNMSFTPAFDLASVAGQFAGGVEAPKTAGFEQNLELNIALNSTNNTNLMSRTLSVNGSANLQIRGTAADPVLLGRVNLNSGDVIVNGTRFVLTGGTVQFINPTTTEPVLNVALTTTIKEYKIDLHFRGPTSELRTQYTSNPSLPPADIINLLAFGQTTEASAVNSSGMSMNQQAEGLVASQVSSQVTSRISKAAGISQLSISPVLAGGTAAGPPGANLTIQQRVAGNLFVTFSTNVATTQGQTIQGQYQLSPRVTVSATRDPNGGFAVDTLIKKSW